jgi:integrase
MTRTTERLTALKAKRAKRGLHHDGHGLYLQVTEGGQRSWVYRYMLAGRAREMGLGPLHTVSLKQARERARSARLLKLDGIDPIERKRAERAARQAADAKSKTFAQCVDDYFRDHANTWSARYRSDWMSSLRQHAIPVLGPLPIAAIDTPLVLKALRLIWNEIPETASRVRNRIETVINWATAHHYRSGDNPAQWNGRLEHPLPTRRKVAPVKHFAALPYVKIASFMARLRTETSAAAACLQFIALTCARLSEAIGATWDEVDLANKVWVVPASRMKGGKEHRVPLSDVALAVLKEMQAIRRSDYVFPGHKEGRPVGDNSVWRLAKRAAESNITVHGLRATFRIWAAERTSFSSEVAEAALAHAVPDAVVACYKRTDFFDRRRKLMEQWGVFCTTAPTERDKVVAMQRRA